jgi:cell division protein FtsL
VLAVVICAIALSLAYPIREYIAERRQIDQLEAQTSQLAARLQQLHAERQALSLPGYIEQQARDQLHMCLPSQSCYVVINPAQRRNGAAPGPAVTPWYAVLWASVRAADKVPASR